MTKVVNIEGVERRMTASAILPKQYRAHFGKDLIGEMTKAVRAKLKAAGKPLANLSDEDIKEVTSDAEFDDLDLTVFENLGWLMLRNGGEDVGDSPDEWLNTLESPLTIYQLMGPIIDLWQINNATTAIPKKK